MQFSHTLKQLLNLLADGRFHSGTELAAALGISRSAVWKQLQTLPEHGVELTALSGKGYKLPQALQFLNHGAVEAGLNPVTQALLAAIEIHDSLPSTSAYLQERAQQGAASGLVCATEYQTAGKGRRGRAWVSPFGQNIYVSMLWRYADGPAAIAGLSLALGVAVARALKRFGLSEIGLKWPNDIYWRQQKLAGILVEVSGESGGPCHAVIGLGVNFYLTPRQAESIEQAWTDLSTAMGSGVWRRRNELLALLLNEMMPVIANFESTQIQQFTAEWRGYDCMRGRAANLLIGQYSHAGTVAGIDDEGFLLLQDSDGRTRAYASGEVSLKLS